jgi:uncharacterized Zn finger protein (UPF0148 family)
MMEKICPICKTALKETKDNQVKCITCQAVISEDIQWQSKYGYEWVQEDAKT